MWLCGIVHALGMAYAIQKALFVVLIHSYALLILQWRYNGRDDVSNHHPHGCLLNRLFGRGSKKTSKLRVNGLCGGNSPVTGEFPAQRASNEGNVSIFHKAWSYTTWQDVWISHGQFIQITITNMFTWSTQTSLNILRDVHVQYITMNMAMVQALLYFSVD